MAETTVGADVGKYYPWTYGLLYNNRNESTAVTSGGGAWVAKRTGGVVRLDSEDVTLTI